jgi:hypothetical protein
MVERLSATVKTDPEAHPVPGRDHALPSTAEVKERVQVYLYSPSGPSWFYFFFSQIRSSKQITRQRPGIIPATISFPEGLVYYFLPVSTIPGFSFLIRGIHPFAFLNSFESCQSRWYEDAEYLD